MSTKIILSSHNFKETPPADELHARAAAMRDAGADIVKIACFANDICDSAVMLSLLQKKKGKGCRGGEGEREWVEGVGSGSEGGG